MKSTIILSLAVVSVMLLSGCATSISTLDPDLSAYPGKSDPAAEKTVYIKTVEDMRLFADNADTPEEPTWANGSQEEARAIGRKRNVYGKALGGLVLPEGMPATSVIKTTLTQALIENGYKVVESESEVAQDTKVFDVRMNKFWSWVNVGFWSIKLSSNIEAVLVDNNMQTVRVEGNYAEHFQTGSESNWLKVLNQTIKNFFIDAKTKLKQK